MLNAADQLAICGYSFGDKGINTVILEWFYAKPDRRRLLLIHPAHKELIKNARGAIRNRWKEDLLFPDEASLEEATTVITKRLEEVSVEKFLEHV